MTTRLPETDSQRISFGPFQLLVGRRLLLERDRPVRIGSRALDILIALATRPGQLLTQRELIEIVWPRSVVVDANLTVHVASLRRALGDGRDGNRYIVTTPGRGYHFVAAVSVEHDAPHEATSPSAAATPHNLPTRLTRLIGRERLLELLAHVVPVHRLVTLVGPGGIGKTAVALQAAEDLLPRFRDGVWLVDLAPIVDPRLVATTVAAALKLDLRANDPVPGLVAALREHQILLVLDNCEHVIEAAAIFANRLLQGTQTTHVLATSREPLNMQGERIYRLGSLESPAESLDLSAAQALQYPAVRLFVERAAAISSEFELSDADAPRVGAICRGLDGMPLAIEFAAARVDTLGVGGIASGLKDRLQLLRGGWRGALPRHRTISAALDWSYQLLSAPEQALFRRLSVFMGGFTLESARAAMANSNDTGDIGEHVASLVMKSLVSAGVGAPEMRFRLLETSRSFALAKLNEHGESAAAARAHAICFRDALESEARASGEDFIARFAQEIDNIRVALTWAFSPEGDARIAVALATASAPIWFELSLLPECHGWMQLALNADGDGQGTQREVILQSALGLSLLYTQGIGAPAQLALRRASDLAQTLREHEWQMRALVALTTIRHRLEEFPGALDFARRAEAIAGALGDAVSLSMTESVLSSSLFFMGHYADALRYGLRAVSRSTPAVRRANIVRWGMDPSVYSTVVIVNALLRQGRLDQAVLMGRQLLRDAQSGGHPISLCSAHTWVSCSLALIMEDWEELKQSAAELKRVAEKHGLESYYACGLGYEGILASRRGDISGGIAIMRQSLAGLRQSLNELVYSMFLTFMAEVLAADARIEEATAMIDEALERARQSGGSWYTAEAHRIKADVILLSPHGSAAIAQSLLERSLAIAQGHGALLWELRAAMSLGRLRERQGRSGEAHDILQPVFERFTEGLATADLIRARTLLGRWTAPAPDREPAPSATRPD